MPAVQRMEGPLSYPLKKEFLMNVKCVVVALLASLITVPAVAEEEKAAKKKRNQGARKSAAVLVLKQLEPVGLTEDQIAKIKEIGAASTEKMKSIREEAGLTPEIMKKRAAAQKSLREAGKKGKDLAAAINEEAGLNEAQAAALVKINESRQKFHKDVIAILTDEQKEKLPAKLQRLTNAGERKNKGQAKAGQRPAKRKAQAKAKADSADAE